MMLIRSEADKKARGPTSRLEDKIKIKNCLDKLGKNSIKPLHNSVKTSARYCTWIRIISFTNTGKDATS